MKRLLIGSVLTLGVGAVGWLAFNSIQENVDESAQTSQSAVKDVNQLNESAGSTEINKNQDVITADMLDDSSSVSAVNDAGENQINVSLYGNLNQPGTRLHMAINNLLLKGMAKDTAISSSIDDAINDSKTSLLSPAAIVSTQSGKPTAFKFMSNMVATNDLFETTKNSIEQTPEATVKIVDLGVVYYPDFAQEVINAAVMTGQMDPNEALLAAIAAGADPSTVSEATAAGNITVPAAGLPLAGLGGGGNGNEDLSASNN